MASITFTYKTTVIPYDWCNDVNKITYTLLQNPDTIAQLLSNIGLGVEDGPTFNALTVTTNIVVSGTVDGRDIATDGTQLDTNTSKLAGIEAGADVTDTANVTAAGALMDSEVDADLKTLALPANTTISTYGASLVDDADAAAARTTLALGTIATENTAPITKGGTGQTTAQAAIDALSQVSGATNEHVLTKDTATGNATWKAATGGGGAFKGALVYNNASWTISDTTDTVLTFNQESYDTDTIHDTSTNTDRLTVPTGATKVRLTAKITWTAGATGYRHMWLRKNGNTFVGNPEDLQPSPSASHTLPMTMTSAVLIVTGGDYFNLHVYQNAGADRTITGGGNGNSTWFSMEVLE